jgi:hypothetical protein
MRLKKHGHPGRIPSLRDGLEGIHCRRKHFDDNPKMTPKSHEIL